jgi:hypothetical protein
MCLFDEMWDSVGSRLRCLVSSITLRVQLAVALKICRSSPMTPLIFFDPLPLPAKTSGPNLSFILLLACS